ncbi:MAG: hypothetical protein KAR64_06400, partial [Thermoplasmatales archaeon]|nr:hypothetical protein [Thermoplasmatales archaeon]
MTEELRKLLKIETNRLDEINSFLMDGENALVNDLLAVIDKYGGPDQINNKAQESGNIDNLLHRLETKNSSYVKHLDWLIKQINNESFISINDYRRKILGDAVSNVTFNENCPVTLEISACQYFPWLIEEAKQSIEKEELMPGRFIRVRNMKEQTEDDQVIAFAAGMQIVGSSYVETLDSKGTFLGPDGAPVNVHLGGPDTITGYFGGVGMPNEFALKWADEFLHYFTTYGVKEVLNINP